MSRRIQRLNEELRREISDILRREVRDPRIGIPTVTRVEVTADLWLARVFVRVGGSDDERREAMEGLEAAAPFVRRALGGMRVRRVPEIRFEADATLEHASRIEALLRDVEPASGWAEEPEAAEEADAADDGPGAPEDQEDGVVSEALERAGVLPVDKPAGPTSHDLVAAVRRALGTPRVGHAGTLDPFATGLLLMCVGQATRLVEFLVGLPKEYVATAHLGVRTTTDDPEGEVEATSEAWRTLGAADIAAALAAMLGKSAQTPPRFSAKKVAGESAHYRARRGEVVELAPVEIEVLAVDLLEWRPPEVDFRVRCSSGTYVRVLARDLGERLGTGAHLSALRRTAVGAFRVEDALVAEALDDAAARDRAWIAPEDALAHLPRVEVGSGDADRLAHGQAITLATTSGGTRADGTVVVLSDHALVAVAERAGGRLRPTKVFRAAS